MQCPKCSQTVPDGAVICDRCNEILDSSFLGADITNDGKAGEPAATRIKPDPRSAATRVISSMPEPDALPDEEPAPAPAEEEAPRVGMKALLDAASAPPAASEAMADLVGRFRRLPFFEKLTIGAACGLFASLGLPWQWTKANGDEIGFLAGAWPVGALALLVAAAVFLREHERVARFRSLVLQAATAAAFVALAVCLLYPRMARHESFERLGLARRVVVVESEPRFAAFAGLLLAALMFAGMVKTMLDADRS